MKLDLATERLDLGPFGANDAELWAALRTDPEVMKFIRPPRTRAEALAEAEIMCSRGADGALGFWRIVERATGVAVGTAILLPLPVEQRDPAWRDLSIQDLTQLDVELGYHLKPAAWGQGYATEAAEALLKFGFEQTPLEKILAVTNPENQPSQRVLKKIGMTDTGLRRAYSTGVLGFEITRTDWLARQAA